MSCDGADDPSDGVGSQLSADLPDDDDDAADVDDEDGGASCYSSAGNQSPLNSADDNAHPQLPSPQNTAAAAAAAAAALISDQYSVETLLANVQALLKLAIDSIRHREQQVTIKAGPQKILIFTETLFSIHCVCVSKTRPLFIF